MSSVKYVSHHISDYKGLYFQLNSKHICKLANNCLIKFRVRLGDVTKGRRGSGYMCIKDLFKKKKYKIMKEQRIKRTEKQGTKIIQRPLNKL